MKKKILIIIGAFSVAFLVTAGILLFSGPRMKNQPSLKAFEAEVPEPPDDVVFFDHEKFDPSTLSLPEMNSENLERGQVYYGYYCIFCHGDRGEGNGPVGQSYIPKPSDLNTSRVKSYDLQQLYRASFTGTGHSPVLERVVPDAHRQFILAYIHNGVTRSDSILHAAGGKR